jgi:hypothetical protein
LAGHFTIMLINLASLAVGHTCVNCKLNPLQNLG